jgi:deoxyribonuclease-4
MPLLGAHMSIAGGYQNALSAADAIGCDTVQLFTKNNNQWRGKPISADESRLFRRKLAEFNLRLPMAHDSYLINLASPNELLWRQSVEAFVVEVERAEILGLAYLVMHPGTPTDGDEEKGLRRIVRALDETHRRCRRCNVMVLLETTAGQGKSVGHRFEQLARILDLAKHPERLGVCLDTCHVFAAGYAMSNERAYRATMAEFDRIIGLEKLRAFHLNDSAKAFGSRVDRHAHIGQGHLGLEAFRYLLNDRRFRDHPMVLETPKEGPNGEAMDPDNLATLRGLIGARTARNRQASKRHA